MLYLRDYDRTAWLDNFYYMRRAGLYVMTVYEENLNSGRFEKFRFSPLANTVIVPHREPRNNPSNANQNIGYVDWINDNGRGGWSLDGHTRDDVLAFSFEDLDTAILFKLTWV